jgi:secreted Zn-dependent insulinase-like peptidase
MLLESDPLVSPTNCTAVSPCPRVRVWWYPDVLFGRPTTTLAIALTLPGAAASPQASVLSALVLDAINEQVR